jgi:hypothetical protein
MPLSKTPPVKHGFMLTLVLLAIATMVMMLSLTPNWWLSVLQHDSGSTVPIALVEGMSQIKRSDGLLQYSSTWSPEGCVPTRRLCEPLSEG